MMKITPTGMLKRVSLAAVLLGVLQACGAAEPDNSYDRYRCIVGGDESACHSQQSEAGPERLVPGSYAQYLIHNGMGEAKALAEAMTIGEEPTLQPATGTQLQAAVCPQ